MVLIGIGESSGRVPRPAPSPGPTQPSACHQAGRWRIGSPRVSATSYTLPNASTGSARRCGFWQARVLLRSAAPTRWTLGGHSLECHAGRDADVLDSAVHVGMHS